MDKTTITFEGLEYDPYFILDVTPDDSDKHITSAFRKKVKRYHPDKTTNVEKKERYQTYFQIIHLSYKHIMNKRSKCSLEACQTEASVNTNISNCEFAFGQGYQTERMSQMEDYSKNSNLLQKVAVNQFANKKFSASHFNNLFIYNQQLQKAPSPKVNNKALIKSSDGFYAYNSLRTENCANVCSYNGLMIACDNDNDIGYWSSNYSDYKQTLHTNVTKNPSNTLLLPQNFKKSGGMSDKHITRKTADKEKDLYNMQLHELEQKEVEDKKKVLQHIKLFDPKLARQALDGELEMSPSLINVLKQHHYKTISQGSGKQTN
jgi:hypothetical protein